MSEPALRVVSAAGLAVLVGAAWALSSNRRAAPWRTVAWGIGLQLVLGAVLLKTEPGRLFFVGVNAAVARFLATTEAGARFVLGSLMDTGFSFATSVLPVIIFMGSIFAVLHHFGIVQRIVAALAWALSRTLGISGAESLAAAMNVFVGMVETGFAVRPYLAGMTRSELFSVMTVGMATVSGSVLVAYVSILGGDEWAGHLVTASLLSAPAALVVAKLMIPETDTPLTSAPGSAQIAESESVNAIDAAASGALAGAQLAIAVGALLIAFVALVALLNAGLASLGAWVGWPGLRFETLLGGLMAPVAALMGVPWEDARTVGSLIGIKTVLNEFLAYEELGALISEGRLAGRSAVIASYALCGFANFGSLAILLGGLGGMAPERRPEMAELGLRSIVAGTLATCMTGCVAGLLL